jgi:hypothetical protein
MAQRSESKHIFTCAHTCHETIQQFSVHLNSVGEEVHASFDMRRCSLEWFLFPPWGTYRPVMSLSRSKISQQRKRRVLQADLDLLVGERGDRFDGRQSIWNKRGSEEERIGDGNEWKWKIFQLQDVKEMFCQFILCVIHERRAARQENNRIEGVLSADVI